MIQTSQLVQYLLATAIVAGILVYLPVKITVHQILEKLDESHRVAAEAKALADQARKNWVHTHQDVEELRGEVAKIRKQCPACQLENQS